jgi:hypothetical protein
MAESKRSFFEGFSRRRKERGDGGVEASSRLGFSAGGSAAMAESKLHLV